MFEEVKLVVQRQERIVNTGPKQPPVSPELVAAALGAEIIPPAELPKRIRDVAFCPLVHRRTQ